MLNQPLIDQLHALRLYGMAASFEQQSTCTDLAHQPFENRLGLMIEQERLTRASARLAQRLRWAKLPLPACLEDLDTRTARGIDPAQLAALVDLGWLRPKELEKFEAMLDGEYYCGDISAADFTIFPMVALLLRMDLRKKDLGMAALVGPRLTAWKVRLEALPLFVKTWPPHWKTQ